MYHLDKEKTMAAMRRTKIDSLTSLADIAEISIGSVSRALDGKPIRLKTLLRLCHVLQSEPRDLTKQLS